MELKVTTLEGKDAGSVQLSDAIFGLDPRADIIARCVQWQLNKRQAGTHKAKGRAEIWRTGKKMYKQKGTGGARHGSRRAAQFVGGAKAHGPVVRSHAFDLPKKVRALALRHALAPGTFDPPNFRLGDCSTQRNLSDEGRQQARRIGAWFRAQGLTPARVRSSPWCRCVDTAALAFGTHEAWAALGSPRGATEGTNAESLAALREGVRQAGSQPKQLSLLNEPV